MSVHSAAIVVVVVVSLALMLTRPRRIAEAWWIAGGTFLLLVFGLMGPGAALKAAGKGLDVYAFLIGMMLLSELARAQGVFEWLSSRAVGWARGSTARLFTIVYVVGVVVTIFLSNDATAVVLTPAILAAVRKANVDPLPHLHVCAFVANAASFVLPISNPANLVVFHDAMPPLDRWLAGFFFPSVLSIVVTYLALRLVFRRELDRPLATRVEIVSLGRSGRWVLAALALVASVLLVASRLNLDLGLPTLLSALVVVAAVSLATRASPLGLARHVSWSTLLLVAGLFVMVEAVQQIGAVALASRALARVAEMSPAAGAMVVAFAVGTANNVVNNLPLGLLTGATVASAHPSLLLTRALLIGVDLGPNLAVTGSLATLLWLIALRREHIEVSFWDFLRVGAVVMPPALIAAVAGLLL